MGMTAACESCGGWCMHGPACAAMREIDAQMDVLWKPFEAACLSAYEQGRTVTGVTLPEGIAPGVASLVNPVTREMVPVTRVPLIETAEAVVAALHGNDASSPGLQIA